MPGRRPRKEVIAPSEHKSNPPKAGQVIDLTLGERVFVLRQRAGYPSHAALSEAAREHLPAWVTMNRKVIQEIESGKIPPEQVNDVWLLAVAAACGANAKTVFGVERGKSEDLDLLADLLSTQFR
jgi:hypothetical protein